MTTLIKLNKISDEDLDMLGEYFDKNNILSTWNMSFIQFVDQWQRGGLNGIL